MSRFWKLIVIAVLGMAAWWGVNSSQAAPSAAPDQPEAALLLVESWTYDDRLQDGSYLGISVSGAGDVNCDNYADVLVGAEKYDLVDTEGAALAFYGSGGGVEDDPAWIVVGALKAERFGSAVSGAGDVNGDGCDDVLVGANQFKEGDYQSDEGAAFLYFGSQQGLATQPAWQVQSDQKEASMGSAVSGAGDINGDDFADVIVGAPHFEVTDVNTNEGAAFVFYGSNAGLSPVSDWVAGGGRSEALFGAAVSGAGDVNSDGWDDVIIGAPQYRMAITDTLGVGAAFVFYGSADGLNSSPAWMVIGNQADGQFGASVAGAGDVNQDGYADVLVGQPHGRIDGVIDTGAAYLYLGSSAGLSETPAWIAYGSKAAAQFGAAVNAAGDLDEDGLPDVVVGAPYFSLGNQSKEGAIFIFSGRLSGLSAAPSAWVYGDKSESLFGLAVANAGDVDQDGQPELLVGSPTYKLDTVFVGRSFLFSSQVTDGWSVFLPFILR